MCDCNLNRNNNSCCDCMRGPKGDTGCRGPKGDPGEPGQIGPRGYPGEIGPKGCKGDKGDRGCPGPQGTRGEIGPQGISGPMGPKGPKGDDGEQGLSGPQGEQGPQGPTGESPFVGENGNWWIGTNDTGVKAQGETGPAWPIAAGSFGTVVGAVGIIKDKPIEFVNGFFAKGVSIDSTKTVITLNTTQFYRITFHGYMKPINGNPYIAITKDDINFYFIAVDDIGLSMFDYVLPFEAGTKISFVARNGDINIREAFNNEVNCFLNIVGLGNLD